MKKLKPDHQNQITCNEPSIEFWTKLVQGPVFVAILTSAFAFVGTILLYRHLGSAEAGEFTLVLAIVQIGVMLGGLGQATLIQRLYSFSAPDEFDWVRDLVVSNLIAFPLIVLISIIALTVYRLTPGHSLIIFALIIMQSIILTESRILNATRRYSWASVLMRVPNSLLLFPALALFMFEIEKELNFVFGIYIVMTFLVSFVGIIILLRVRQRGRRYVSWRERLSGVVFLFTQSSYTLPDQGIVALGGGLVSSNELASYGAISPLLKPFELLTDVLRNILTTELIHLRSRRLHRAVFWLWGIGFGLASLIIFVGPSVSRWIYSGRYVEGSKLIPWLAIAGFFRLIEVFPRSYIIGQTDQGILRTFVFWQVMSAGLFLVLGLGLIISNGVLAIAWSMAAIQLGRYLVSEAHYRKAKRLSRES